MFFTFYVDERKGVPIGPRVITSFHFSKKKTFMNLIKRTFMTSLKMQAYSYWLYNVPWGLHKAMMYIKERYGNPTVILAENGMNQIISLLVNHDAII